MSVAAAILMITMGSRQSLGLFIAPIIDSTHVGYAAMSFVMAVGQLVWGAMQPAFGAFADRYGAFRVLLVGALLLAAGTVLTTLATNEFALIATLGFLTAAGAGAGSFAVLIGVVAQRVPAEQAFLRLGLRQRRRQPGPIRVRAAQPVPDLPVSWMGAMWTMAGAALVTIPLAGLLTRRPPPQPAAMPHTRGTARRRPPARSPYASNWPSRHATRATGACTPDSSPADSTSPSWSRTCPAR